MILFVDDDIERHKVFAARRAGEPDLLQTASMVTAWIELRMNSDRVREIWLDHDLGHALNPKQVAFEDINDIDVIDIMPLVRWMCTDECKIPRGIQIVVHSWNQPAAYRMATSLRQAGYTNVTTAPFRFPAAGEP